jgi:YHS domain-containing protein
MIRFLVFCLVSVFLITLVKAFIGIILKGLAELMNPREENRSAPGAQQVPAGGVLRKDPVCGTYVAESSSVKLTVKGETVHFCSSGCRDKFTKV